MTEQTPDKKYARVVWKSSIAAYVALDTETEKTVGDYAAIDHREVGRVARNRGYDIVGIDLRPVREIVANLNSEYKARMLRTAEMHGVNGGIALREFARSLIIESN